MSKPKSYSKGRKRKPKNECKGRKKQQTRLKNSVGTRDIVEIKRRRESIENLMDERGVRNYYDLSPYDQYKVMALRRGWGGEG